MAPKGRGWIYAWVGACLLALGAGAGYLAAHRSLPRESAREPNVAVSLPPAAAPATRPAPGAPGASSQQQARPIEAKPEPEPEDFASETEPGPQAPGETAPETGTLRIQSSPPFAQVYLDGQHMGVTPLVLAGLAPGNHRILLKRESEHPVDTVIPVQPGMRDLRIRLSARSLALGAED